MNASTVKFGTVNDILALTAIAAINSGLGRDSRDENARFPAAAPIIADNDVTTLRLATGHAYQLVGVTAHGAVVIQVSGKLSGRPNAWLTVIAGGQNAPTGTMQIVMIPSAERITALIGDAPSTTKGLRDTVARINALKA